jgi:hypothetical protein
MKLNLAKYHPIVSSIITILEKETIPFETFEHEDVLTSEEAARTRPGYTLSQGAKALILKASYKDRTKPSEFIMMVLPGDKKIRLKTDQEPIISKRVIVCKYTGNLNSDKWCKNRRNSTLWKSVWLKSICRSVYFLKSKDCI